MSFTVKHGKKDDCILVTVHGDFKLSILSQLAFKVKQLIDQNKCTRILTDLREAQLTDSPVDMYKMPDSAISSGINRNIKRALLVKKKTQDFHFLETVFVNRGNVVKIFDNLNEARKWLNSN